MLNLSSETESVIRKVTNNLVYSGLLFAVSCGNSDLKLKSNTLVVKTPTAQIRNTPDAKDSLEQKALRLMQLYDSRNCKEFFNAFPNTFDEFDQLYGFDDKEGERILYSKYPEHFPYFFSCPEVPAKEKLNKVIRIGIDGRYNDGVPVDMFHDSVFNLIITNPNEANKVLEGLPNEKAASFWYFLFDRPNPSDKENARKVVLLKNVLGENSKQSKLLSEQYKKLLVDWSEH